MAWTHFVALYSGKPGDVRYSNRLETLRPTYEEILELIDEHLKWKYFMGWFSGSIDENELLQNAAINTDSPDFKFSDERAEEHEKEVAQMTRYTLSPEAMDRIEHALHSITVAMALVETELSKAQAIPVLNPPIRRYRIWTTNPVQIYLGMWASVDLDTAMLHCSQYMGCKLEDLSGELQP